ncbi:MAG: 3'-5' exoribonuclease YhaM [Deltaproteobacteria bacterium ADurb.BinA179]|nr:HD domain-containing protein [Deltaproteobacteria bacterium]MDI9543443.1 HD domain-containing protein [Pseudomonadota bacterium]NLW68879.1 HD domain-containing protein [Bacteriovoracaceae bacterium]OPZ30183.1 MAG: 3'-5' exoribonuclease YhaM [Deltaproteobacteria bacterium ADurb.BinA179]HRR20205.1 HD domain-containing protein [Desulfomonilia bacterium]
MISKGKFVSECRDGDPIRAVFLLSQRKIMTARNGKPYAKVLLTDRSGDILGMVWEDARQQVSSISPGDVVGIRGGVESYDGRLQIRIEKIVKLKEDDVEMASLIATTSRDIPSMMAEIETHIAGIKDAHLKALIEALFSSDSVRNAFQKAPAAKGVHHNYIGGLLEHTLSIIRSIHSVLPLYEHLGMNRDLLVAGALLHDIGKIYEYSFSRVIDMTAMGRLIGHVYLSAYMTDQAIAGIPAFPDELRLQLLHMILGHHGQLEFGSPKLPMTKEAILLHILDDLDAKLIGFSSIIEATPEDEDFSSFSSIYNRYLYTRIYEGEE